VKTLFPRVIDVKRVGIPTMTGALMLLAPLGHTTSASAKTAAPPAGPEIQIEDVYRFYKLYDATGGHPTADQLQHDYLDPGSDGLHKLAKVRNVTGTRIADNIAKRPEMYSDARQCMTALPRVRQRLEVALHTLGRLYPNAKFPPVTIAVGRGKPMGTTSADTGVLIGLEALCATDTSNPNVEDRFVHVIAHEYAHVQQFKALTGDEHPTVLESALLEGGAEFIAEVISGGVAGTKAPLRGSRGVKWISRRPLSLMKTRPISPSGSTTAKARRSGWVISATGLGIAS